MARGQEETSTSGRSDRRTRATPSASSIISSLTMEELIRYCEVPDDIIFRLVDRPDESTMSVEHNGVFFTRGASRNRVMLSLASHCQTIFTLYPGASGPCTPQCDSHPNRMLRAKPFVPA